MPVPHRSLKINFENQCLKSIKSVQIINILVFKCSKPHLLVALEGRNKNIEWHISNEDI